MMNWKAPSVFVAIFVIGSSFQSRSAAVAFSQPQQNDSPLSALSDISRRDYWKISLGVVGAVGYGKLVGDSLSRIALGIERPVLHEERVEQAITRAIVESALSNTRNSQEPFRILEVGIGTDIRLIRRGFYKHGLEDLARRQVSQVELTGVDPIQPSKATIEKATNILSQETRDLSTRVQFDTVSGDIEAGLSALFPSGYFDVVVCVLTLCSVTNQQAAIQEMKRLVRPSGGTFGYVEHVAVNPNEPYRLLEWQQELFDPLQQKLADNCHLHRYTENAIDEVFGASDEYGTGVRLQQERFLVNDMWPVTCQTSGVIQMRRV